MKTLNEYLEKHADRYQENKLPGCGWSVEKWALKLVEEVGEFAQTLTKDQGDGQPARAEYVTDKGD